MNVLLLGNNAATHALALKIFDSSLEDRLVCAPGNGGTGMFTFNAPFNHTAESDVIRFVYTESIDLLICDEAAVIAGLGEPHLIGRDMTVGAGRAIAPVLTSRAAFAAWTSQQQLPTLKSRAFTNAEESARYAAGQPLPLRVCDDSWETTAQVCHERADAYAAIQQIDGRTLVIEEVVTGPVVVVQWLMDDDTLLPLPPVRVYPLEDQGGNLLEGAHITATAQWDQLVTRLNATICAPVAAALRKMGVFMRSWVCAECVVTAHGPLLTRLAVTPPPLVAATTLLRMASDVLPLLIATAENRLKDAPAPTWRTASSVAVLLRTPVPSQGLLIEGLDDLDGSVRVYHQQTFSREQLIFNPPPKQKPSILRQITKPLAARAPILPLLASTGPQILVVASAANALFSARVWAYDALETIRVVGTTYRRDIGAAEI